MDKRPNANKLPNVNMVVQTGNIAVVILLLYLAIGHYTGWYENSRFMYLTVAGLGTYQGIVSVIDQSIRIYSRKKISLNLNP